MFPPIVKSHLDMTKPHPIPFVYKGVKLALDQRVLEMETSSIYDSLKSHLIVSLYFISWYY